MFCTQCGKPVTKDDKFCRHCGALQVAPSVVVKQKENVTAPIDSFERTRAVPQVVKVRPWARFLARKFDYFLASILGIVVILLFFPEAAGGVFFEEGIYLLGSVVVFGWVFIEAFLLSTLGATPGKWLFNIKIVLPSGEKPDFSVALSRSFMVWWRGMGVDFPLISQITQIVSYFKLKKHGQTSWDRDSGLDVVHEKVGPFRVFLIVLMFLVVIFTVIVVANIPTLSGPYTAKSSSNDDLENSSNGLIAGRYRDNNVGTVTDMQTGLQWKRCYEGENYVNGTCSGEPSTYTWDAAMAKFGQGNSYAGKHDWRMPKIEELDTLVYCTSGSRANDGSCAGDYRIPTLNTTAFPSDGKNILVWSGSPGAAGTDSAWYVNFSGGYGYWYVKAKGYFQVRLVRGQ